MAAKFIEEETGVLYDKAPDVDLSAADDDSIQPGATADQDPNGQSDDASDLNLIARDANKHPLLSRFDWTDEAAARVLRVPAGFMRDRTQGRVEELAAERRAEVIDLELVEAGIDQGVQMMADMIGQMEAEKKEAPAQAAAPTNGGNGTNGATQKAAGEAQTGGCPFSKLASENPDEARSALNEISVMSEMERKRREMEQPS